MTYEEIKIICHVRSAIRRKSKPKIKYWKNHDENFDSRVQFMDKQATDWEEYDPNDED